ncbi:GabA permease [Cryptococcus deuterogattii 99/473]|uniref:GabA permease n=1 Tax=Cryptococcus deuterogattii Ram5 TaxID=1296110 RepID=A0A0D0TTH3_9TREE|nr:GabA permease [Cryptococcus deuterogattii LA55]KIR39018.1 GabA permease [Cryptococcus deuterogattii Ram5]KIR76044.1 GabA permease [Cryptococcus deuterogattii CA1014]KIR95988.1 GabA permease [Cryptococcus deuterogattii CBS 10090]KIS02484.1 GabA permease [Cryptococcus deuterogattii 2001/935-1]KIY58931.1 GabA permease [Cryptococcus deuterogattii 99/473]
MSLQEDIRPASLRSDPDDVTGSDGGHSNKKPTTSLTRIEAVGDAQPDNEFSVMGYTPQLKRLTIQTMLLSLFAVPFGISSGFYTAMIGGGPASLVWGFILVGCLQECVAVSLGEICSRFPTSGGPYYWSYALAPPSIRTMLSYVTGWLYMLAIWMLDLGTHYGTAILIVGAINIYYPDWTAPVWVTLVICYGLYVLSTLMTWKGHRWVPMLDTVNAVFTGICLVAIVASILGIAAEGRRSASFVFTHYDWSYSGWGRGFTFCIGLLPGCFVMCGIGFISSMSEEVAVPTKQIPRAMVIGIPVAILSGLVFILGCLFTLPDIDKLLNAPGGSPMPVILATATGSKAGGVALLSLIISNAAIAWNALIVSTIIQMLIALIGLGSSSAFNAFLNVGIIGVDLAYGMPIAISLCSGRKLVKDAPWYTGFLGKVCNIISVLWISFSLVLFSMPIAIPVDAVSANYAPLVLVFFMGFSALWYIIQARKVYKGPPPVDFLVSLDIPELPERDDQ